MSDQGLSIFDEPEGTDGSSTDEEATQVMPAVKSQDEPEKKEQPAKPATDDQPTRQTPASPAPST